MKTNMTIIAALAGLMLAGCSNKNEGIPEWPWYDESDPDKWELADGYGKLPDYVKVFKASESSPLKGRKAIAYIAEIDATKASFEVWGLSDPTLSGCEESLKTPTDVYNEQGGPAIIINGGFFYTDSGLSYAASLAVNNGVLLSPNINYASEDWVDVYYPTRGVFLEHSDGSYEAAWTYWADEEHHYLYQSPAANSFGNPPLAVPGADFPCEATAFEAKNGIGGGPVLIKGGKVVNSYTAELFNGETSGILVDTCHPRTAIGITADKKLVLFVCEGREMTEGVPGYTTQEVAKILLSYGCVEALNLDGGGSTCMLVNGVETVKPSDGEERAVGSCVIIR